MITNRVEHKNLAGVDFTDSFCSNNRFPDLKNMLKTYEPINGTMVETRKGLVKYFNQTGVVYGIYFFKKSTGLQVIVHIGTTLYKWNNFPDANTLPEHSTVLKTGMNARKSSFFDFDDDLFIHDGINYMRYDGTTIEDVLDIATIPTTSIARTPAGAGTDYQPVNFLQDKKINQFLSDGVSTEYYLDTIEVDSIVEILVNGSTATNYTLNSLGGYVTFDSAPAKSIQSGVDNVIITYSKDVDDYNDIIQNCTLSEVFDNRVFFSGNVNYPNYIFNCRLQDPTYFSDLDYYQEGFDSAPVKAMVAGASVLWVFKEENQENATVFYHQPTINYDYDQKVYPSIKGKSADGCTSDATNFNNDIVFLTKKGLVGIDASLENEEFVSNRTRTINPKLILEDGYEDAQIEEWNDYLLIYVNGKIYLVDGKQPYTDEFGSGYESYYFDGIGSYDGSDEFTEANLIKTYDGDLYIGTKDGYIVKYEGTNDYGKVIESYLYTNRNTLGYPQRQKVTNKKGAIVNVKPMNGMFYMYAIKNGETKYIDAFWINEYTDFIVPKIKAKKWTDIQFLFKSDELDKPFGIKEFTYTAFIGSYRRR